MPTTSPKRWPASVKLSLAALLLSAAAMILPATAAAGGGIGATTGADGVPGQKAKLVKGKAIAPASAPEEVKEVIAAANKIRKKPYKYGGGHGRWNDKGYDCSGAVSYALRGAGLIDSPMASYDLAKWGDRGKGDWITVYGARSHAYMVVAGLRFDTSMTPGDGPGWSKSLRSTPESYKKRHPDGL